MIGYICLKIFGMGTQREKPEKQAPKTIVKVGRPKLIASPEELYGFFQDYKIKTKSTPRLVHDFVGKFADSVYREREEPLTMEGFENYVADQGGPWDLDQYFAAINSKKDGSSYAEFSSVCSRIRREIRQDQISGGLSGIYNPSITQRLNGLVDKTQVTTIVEQPLFEDDVEESNESE